MKRTFFILLLVTISLQSCNEFLDIKPKGVSVPKKASEYEQLLNYAQMTKGLEVYMNYLTDDAYLPDKGYAGFETKSDDIRNLYTFQSMVFGPAEWDILWLQSYNRIYYANVVANQVMDSEGDVAYKKRVRADALVMRAFDYLGLVNAYAKHYDKATAGQDIGVPLQLDENITNDPITRVSVQRIYDQVKSDLEEAVEFLPEVNLLPYRGSRPFAQGLLSRMYFYMGDYEKALFYAEEALKTNNTLLDMKLYSVVDPDKTSGRTDLPDADQNPENINIRFSPATAGLSGQVFPSQELKDLYSADDMRLKLLYTHKVGSNVVADLIYAAYTQMNVSSSVAEMYLVAAECYARKDNKVKAMEYLNKVMENRILNFVPESVATAEDALRKVLDERRREFAFNGLYRLVDLKRLNKDPRFRKTVVHAVEGKTYTLEPESPKYVLPIPIMVLDMNPDMEPNIR